MARHKTTLMYFWEKSDTARNATVKRLKQLYRNYEKEGRLQVVDIMMSPDSAGWKNILAGDSSRWKHYWAPGGTLNRNLLNMNIGKTPYYIVTTSVGKQLYRGASLDDAIKATDSHMQSK